MTNDQLIERVSKMRDEDALQRLIRAAEARALHLSNRYKDKRSHDAFTKWCAKLKPGDIVYIHNDSYKSNGTFIPMFGKPIEVISVHPRKRGVEAWSYDNTNTRKRYSISSLSFENRKIRKEPTAEALAWALERRT